jgi:hypothetical protein
MNNNPISCLTVALWFFVLNSSMFGKSWTGGADGVTWHIAGNWSPSGVPNASSDVVIGVTPALGNTGEPELATDRIIALTNNSINEINSLTYQNSLTDTTLLYPIGAEYIKINGSINNLSAYFQRIQTRVDAGSSATWSGDLHFENTVNIGTARITIGAGSDFVFSGNSISFNIESTTDYGAFEGSGFTADYTDIIININGFYTGALNDTFQLNSGGFTGATIGTLPTLADGLVWNTTDFISSGILSVEAIPEPSTVALLCGFTALGLGATRRRRRIRSSPQTASF